MEFEFNVTSYRPRPTQLVLVGCHDTENVTKWYRFENRDGIFLHAFEVVKETPKGVWLDDYGKNKFVLKDARKRFAYPTIEQAKVSFIARKKSQINILQSQLDGAKWALELIKEDAYTDLTKLR